MEHKMTAQKRRIAAALTSIGAAWATTSDKTVLPSDPLEDQMNRVETYHVHPKQSKPQTEYIQRFTSLVELEDWIREQRPLKRRERVARGQYRYIRLPQDWVDKLKKSDGTLQAAIERLVREELARHA